MAGLGSVVTPEVQQVTDQFEDLVEQRDLVGLGFIAIVGAVGVALANEVVDMVLPRIGFNPDPQRAQDFAVAGLVQVIWAGVLVTIAGSMLAGSPVLFAGAIALSMGSVIIGGANLFEWGQRVFAGFTGSAPRRRGGGTGQGAAQSLEQGADQRTAATDGGVDQPAPSRQPDDGRTAATA